MNLLLVRFAYLPDVTLGWLYAGELKLATLEEGWAKDPDGPGGQRREGNLRESCVPDGSYIVKPHVSQKYPAGVYSIANPTIGVYSPGTRPAGQAYGRDAILIHTGNDTGDIEGCVLVGMRHSRDGTSHVIHESRTALARLKELLGDTASHELYIRPTGGTWET
jgi:hypothetical protein